MKLVALPLLVAALVLIGCSGTNQHTISATGTIEATEVILSAQVSGTVKRVLVDEGLAVHRGDTLVVLDQTDWIFQREQSQANLAATDAQYQLAVRGAREEDLIQAEANYKSAEADLKRMEDLWASKSISQKQLEDAQTRFTLNKQAWEKLKRGSRHEEVEMARARRDQAAAQLASLRKKVSDCTITSPLDGTVTKRFVEEGEFVGVGTSLIGIANLQEMDIMIYVSESELPKVKLNQKAEIKVDAFENRTFEGRVAFISPIAEFTPKNIQTKDERTKLVFGIKINVANPDGSLKAGIPADVTLNSTN